MDSKVKAELQAGAREPSERADDDQASRRVQTWLALTVGVLTLILIALGAKIVTGSGPNEAAPPPQPTAAAPTATSAPAGAMVPRPAGFTIADANITAHVDGSIAAYNRGAGDSSIRMGGHGSSSMHFGPLFRFDQGGEGMVEVSSVRAAVRASYVERTGPVMQFAAHEGGSRNTEARSSTVMFSVRADGQEQIWIQRWEPLWGDTLTRMWVI